MKREEIINYLGFTSREDGMCQYKGYDIIVFDYAQNFITYPIFIMRFNQNIEKEQIKAMAPLLKGFGNLMLDECGYIISINGISLAGKLKEEKLEKIKQKFDDFINYLLDNRIETLSTCILCRQQKEEENLEEHKINNRFVLAHKSCFEEYKNHFINEINKNESNTKAYPLSILFSIVGAIAGVIINYLIVIITGYLIAYGFALIPLGSFYGFKLGKAPINKKAMMITTIISALVLIGSVLGVVCLSYSAIEDTEMTFMQFLTANENRSFILFSILFGILGISLTFGIMKKQTNETKLNSMN